MDCPPLLRFLTSVNTLMCFQVAFYRKSSTTYVTFKRFVTSVNTQVSFQAVLFCKSFITFITFKRFLTSVNTLNDVFSGCILASILYHMYHIYKVYHHYQRTDVDLGDSSV